MTENDVAKLMELTGRIDERTTMMQLDIAEMKKSQEQLFVKANDNKSRLDSIWAEHNQIKENCKKVSEIASQIIPVRQGIVQTIFNKPTIGVTVTGVVIIVILLILKSMGLSFVI
jgi:FtsZ-binding cell division protein ZapB